MKYLAAKRARVKAARARRRARVDAAREQAFRAWLDRMVPAAQAAADSFTELGKAAAKLAPALLGMLAPVSGAVQQMAHTATELEVQRVQVRQLQRMFGYTADQCPACGEPLGGSFPYCSRCQLIAALKGTDAPW
jgi:tRNA(Ile2) C34 agmatinyltransferase TiaS